jgi:pantetheine-phosphate adenylyltransferase
MERESIVIFPGSFDPFTRGHAAVVDEALRLFDKVVIGVGDNISKRGLLTIEQRVALIEESYAANPRVEVKTYSSLTGDFALECGAKAIVRGVRSCADFEYEQNMATMNRHLFPSLSTIILSTPVELSHISSSAVRELLAFGRSVDEFMPESIDINNFLTK